MNFSPCLVIPNYNHGYAFEAIAEDLKTLKLPTIVVNDASTDSTREILERLAATHSWLSVVHRVTNGGKGAAIRDGLRLAFERGFTHAVCIDGDGQHACADIPKFVAAARQYPGSLILGAPLFGKDAPTARRWGREISNVLMVLSAWSFQPRDVLCGFRVYPLEHMIEKVELDSLEPRMGFDVEVVARSLWAGINIKNISTHVRYPEQGISHFRYGRDNAVLGRLFVGLLYKGMWCGPRGLWRRLRSRSAALQWHDMAERGSLVGMRFLLAVFEILGRRILQVLLIPVVVQAFLFRGASRQAAVNFQRRISEHLGAPCSTWLAYVAAFKQFWAFGVCIVDKVISWRQGIPLSKFTWVGRDEVKQLLAQGQGLIFMGAHVGNSEVIRAVGEARSVIINTLMYTEHSGKFRAFLEKVNSQTFLRVHDLKTIDTSLILALQEAVKRGEVVALLGDRTTKLASKRSVSMPFLGCAARFPEGPWILASMLEAPVYSVFSMQDHDGGYRVEFERLADRVNLPRDSRDRVLSEYVRCFAARLEAVVQRYPTQWFNFFDFWKNGSASA